jgi:ABC-2 type transport system permease protein
MSSLQQPILEQQSILQQPSMPLRQLAADSLVVARRSLSHIRQIPEKLIDVTVQPLMFVLLFAFVFGGVIAVPGGNYRDYLIGGILVQTLTFGIIGPATSMATDLGEGIWAIS